MNESVIVSLGAKVDFDSLNSAASTAAFAKIEARKMTRMKITGRKFLIRFIVIVLPVFHG